MVSAGCDGFGETWVPNFIKSPRFCKVVGPVPALVEGPNGSVLDCADPADWFCLPNTKTLPVPAKTDGNFAAVASAEVLEDVWVEPAGAELLEDIWVKPVGAELLEDVWVEPAGAELLEDVWVEPASAELLEDVWAELVGAELLEDIRV